ncbi:MAG: hypothetical protein WC750_04610 [Patescibacteria group bacterium]|jgi:mannose/fructose/N-acetylgalactosamine-specific phosphotransferase system component IIC
MEKIHLGFALVLSALFFIVSLILLSVNKPMANAMGMGVLAISLIGAVFSYLQYKNCQNGQPD